MRKLNKHQLQICFKEVEKNICHQKSNSAGRTLSI